MVLVAATVAGGLGLPDGPELLAKIWVAQVGRVPLLLLDADNDEAAKLEAALMFAVGDFRDAAPVAYRVLEVERDPNAGIERAEQAFHSAVADRRNLETGRARRMGGGAADGLAHPSLEGRDDPRAKKAPAMLADAPHVSRQVPG